MGLRGASECMDSSARLSCLQILGCSLLLLLLFGDTCVASGSLTASDMK